MAGRIAGITIEIGGDTTNLQKSLKGVDSQLKQTQNALKDVNKLLKLDPTNTDLLKQKQQLLKQAVEQTKERLDKLKEAQAQMDAAGVDKNSAQYQALQREIAATEQELKQAEKAARGFSPALESIKASAQKAADGLKTAADKTRALSTAAAGALTALGGLGIKAMKTADEILTMASQTGFSTDELQKFSYAADRLDVSVSDITGAMKKLKTKIDPSNKSLKELGVIVAYADGTLRDSNDVFYDVVRALSRIENETERDQKAMEIFGKSADSLAGIIDDGGEALRQYAKEAEKAGAIMDEETLKALGEMNDEFDKLKAQGMGVLIQTGSKALKALSPVLQQIATAVGNVFEWISKLSPETMKTVLIVLAAVAALSPLLSILASLATAITFLASPIGIAIAAITALIAIGVLLWKNWDKVTAVAQNVANAVKTSWNNLKTSVSNSINATKTAVVNGWNNIKDKISTTVSTIKTSVSTAFSNLKNTITSPFTNAYNTISTAVSNIKNLFPIKLGNLFSGLKLPHFKIDGGEAPWGIGGQGKKPTVSIDWYRKAMEQPYVLNGATIFGAMGGKLLGGGEAGKEVIMSYDKFKNMGGTNNTINVYAAPGQSAKEIAYEVQKVLVSQQRQRSRAYA